jgi:hypothetical protein
MSDKKKPGGRVPRNGCVEPPKKHGHGNDDHDRYRPIPVPPKPPQPAPYPDPDGPLHLIVEIHFKEPLHVHIHHDGADVVMKKLDTIEQSIQTVIRKEMILMGQFATFDTLLKGVDAETDRLSAEMKELIAQNKRTDLTEAEEADIEARLTAVAARLASIGKDKDQPIPPVEA